MAFLAAREASDVIRTNLGLLKPVNLELSDLDPPDTRIVRDVEQHASATHTQDLLSHVFRTYYFGAMLGAYHKLVGIGQLMAEPRNDAEVGRSRRTCETKGKPAAGTVLWNVYRLLGKSY